MDKAILIDPFNKVIEEVDYDYGGSYTQITEYIATPEAHARCSLQSTLTTRTASI